MWRLLMMARGLHACIEFQERRKIVDRSAHAARLSIGARDGACYFVPVTAGSDDDSGGGDSGGDGGCWVHEKRNFVLCTFFPSANGRRQTAQSGMRGDTRVGRATAAAHRASGAASGPSRAERSSAKRACELIAASKYHVRLIRTHAMPRRLLTTAAYVTGHSNTAAAAV